MQTGTGSLAPRPKYFECCLKELQQEKRLRTFA